MPAIELLYQTAIQHAMPRTLIINAHSHVLLSTLAKQCTHLDLHQHFKPEHESLLRMGLQASATLPEHENNYDSILLLPSKNKQQSLGWMAQAMRLLRSGGSLSMACANNHGAKSYASALQRIAGNVISRSKSKCRIFSAKKTSSLDLELDQQWHDAAQPKRIPAHGLTAQAGLFSWDHADIGSQLLTNYLPDTLSGNGMDLCCGYGFLAEHLLRNAGRINTLHLLEADKLALACAANNTATWQQKVQQHWLDARHDLLPKNLDWIVCNPPFHTGQTRDVELGQTIIQHACQSLKRRGTLYIVANRKLPYETLIRQQLSHCQTLVEANGFKIIKGVR